MFMQVISDLKSFMILLLIFIMTFAECYSVVNTDHSSYGRLPPTIALGISALRMAYGDFALVDPKYTFDYVDEETNEYKRDIYIVIFSFVLFVISTGMLFMVFMNFLIAVISDSYATVVSHMIAHDYK